MSKKYNYNHNAGAPVLPKKLQAPMPFIGAILFFFAVCLSASSTVRGMTVIVLVLLAASVVLCWQRLCERISLPLVVLSLFVVMCGVSTLYASSGKFALQEFLKTLFSYSLVLIMLAWTPDGEEKSGHRIGTILAGGSALISLVSIDLLSTRIISTPILILLSLFSTDFTSLDVVESGIRMTSLVDNPNVFAGIAGIGVLLCLGLAISAAGRRRNFYLVCLYTNAVGFVLAFSMGATAMIALAFLVYLLIECKERRAALLVLMVETLILTALVVLPISMTSLQKWSGFNPIPLLCLAAGAVLLCLADRFVGSKIADKLHGKTKIVLALIAAILVAAVTLAILAYNLTGSVQLGVGETLRRSVYPEPGEYTLNVQMTGSANVTIESQNQHDTMMHTSTVLYKGSLDEAAFTVPEDSLVVYFNFTALDKVFLDDVTYTGEADHGSVPLGYQLLPSFMANRIQGLFANQNAIQRLVFFEDGLKLFLQSPIAGLGLGGYENSIRSVQSFYYETKYAHNHYIQLLAETGIIGLALFLGLLVVSAIVVLRTRKREGASPLIPALGSALVFMAAHAATEVDFSVYAYLPFAFGVFALISLCCADGISVSWLSNAVRRGILIGISVLLLVYAGLLAGNLYGRHLARNASSMDDMVMATKIDRFEWADYALTFIVNLPEEGDMAILEQANEFADRLAKLDSNTVPYYLTEFYLMSAQYDKAFAMAEQYVDYTASDARAWQRIFNLLQLYSAETVDYRDSVLALADKLADWNSEHMGNIELSEETMQFLAEIGADT